MSIKPAKMKVFSLCALVHFLLLASAEPQTKPSNCKVVVAGAGIGGVYVAYRLVESGRFRGHDICIFEARQKPGGRMLTVRGAVRGFSDFTIDLGAYRYNRPLHRLSFSVAEKILGLPFSCYSDPLLDNFPECSNEPLTNRIFSTRGRILTPVEDELESYDKESIPYNIQPKYQWGPASQTRRASPRSPMSMLLSLLTTIKPIADHWDALVSTENYTSAMETAETIIRKLRHVTYRGVPLTDVTHWQYVVSEGITPEEMKLYLDRNGPIDADWLHMSVYKNLVYGVSTMALSKYTVEGANGYVTPARVRGGKPRRIGMRSLVDGLIRLNRANGVRMFYNHRVTRVTKIRGKAGEMRINVNNRFNILTGNVFLNVPKGEVSALGVSSEPLRSAPLRFRKVFDRVTPLSLNKMYCFWDDAWWVTKLNYTRGTYVMSDETLYTGRYHDGDVVCTGAGGRAGRKCRGAMLVSYMGDSYATNAKAGVALHVYNRRFYQPWRPDVQGNSRTIYNGSDHDGMLFRDVHRQLRKVHAQDFARLGLDVETALPDAQGCAYADWTDMGAHLEFGPIAKNTNPYRLYTKPVPGLNISLVNEAWSDFNGWAEGSLRSAERALYHMHGVAKPDWLDEPYHRSIIRRFNRG